jgi:predicted DNA-binding protein YlxM (UPF0122 family)
MLTDRQQRRYNLYCELRSLSKVAEHEGVSREAIRKTLDSLPPDSEEFEIVRTIAETGKPGRPRVYADLQEQRRVNLRNWRAKQKQLSQNKNSD